MQFNKISDQEDSLGRTLYSWIPKFYVFTTVPPSGLSFTVLLILRLFLCLQCIVFLYIYHGVLAVQLEIPFLNSNSTLCWQWHFWMTATLFQGLTVSFHAFLALMVLRDLMLFWFVCLHSISEVFLPDFSVGEGPLSGQVYLEFSMPPCVWTSARFVDLGTSLLSVFPPKHSLSLMLISPPIPWFISLAF